MAYDGRFYETVGAEPVAIHEPMDVKLLSPIVRASSVRFAGFNSLQFDYLNPSVMFGPNETLRFPEAELRITPCLAIVIGGSGGRVDVRTSDDLVLGLTLASVFSVEPHRGPGLDIGFALGPALTTPDELDDSVTADGRGRRYRMTATFKVNSVESGGANLSELEYTPAELISQASQTCALYESDLLLMGACEPIRVESKDEFGWVIDKMGALNTRIS
jgi:2-keto-4-pentenoate hydratase/2-oxohepta-3-ene-1,7-dioic acid hydratase in catechol pathway